MWPAGDPHTSAAEKEGMQETAVFPVERGPMPLRARLTSRSIPSSPLGASSVLLFGYPRSPLAQPRNVVPGSAIGVGVTILLGLQCRCLQPPAGGIAFLAVFRGMRCCSLGRSAAGCLGPWPLRWTGCFVPAHWKVHGSTEAKRRAVLNSLLQGLPLQHPMIFHGMSTSFDQQRTTN